MFVAKNYDATSWHDLLHQFGSFCTEFCKATKRSQMHPNSTKTQKHEFRVQWGGSRALVAKNLAHFVLSVVTEPNCPKRTQVVQNALKHEVRVQWGGLSGSLWKIPTRLHGTNFCTSSARFALSFVRQPNGSKYIQIVQNTPKHVFRVQWG